MSSSKIAVFAYSDVGHACLELLLQRGKNVVCVYTHADNPQENRWFPSVRELAERHSVPVRIAEDLRNGSELEFLRSLAPDLILSFYYRHLIPPVILKLPRHGAFNLHGSFLPKYRGRAPVNWAVLKGETRTGATLHEMIEQADAGDIVDQEAVEIGPDDTAATVQVRVTQAAVKVLERQIDNLESGHAPRLPQDHAQATTFGRRRPQDGEIDWRRPAKEIHDLVRAVTHPYPGAFGKINGENVLIWKTRLDPESGGNNPVMICGDQRRLEILEFEQQKERPL